jgi:hypothetical protein
MTTLTPAMLEKARTIMATSTLTSLEVWIALTLTELEQAREIERLKGQEKLACASINNLAERLKVREQETWTAAAALFNGRKMYNGQFVIQTLEARAAAGR